MKAISVLLLLRATSPGRSRGTRRGLPAPCPGLGRNGLPHPPRSPGAVAGSQAGRRWRFRFRCPAAPLSTSRPWPARRSWSVTFSALRNVLLPLPGDPSIAMPPSRTPFGCVVAGRAACRYRLRSREQRERNDRGGLLQAKQPGEPRDVRDIRRRESVQAELAPYRLNRAGVVNAPSLIPAFSRRRAITAWASSLFGHGMISV